MAHGTRWDQIEEAERHGAGTKGQSSDGTGTEGNLAGFLEDGTLTNSGVSASGIGAWVMVIPTGVLNSVNTVFTIPSTPIPGSLTLFLNIVQSEGVDFTISANTITFAVPPKFSDTHYFLARYQH